MRGATRGVTGSGDEATGGLAVMALWVYIVAIAATWGTVFVLIKVVTVAGAPPFLIAALRGLLTAAVLAAWFAAIRHTLALNRASIRHMAVLGVLNGLVPNVLTAMALDEIASAPAALIQASTPLFVALLGHATLPGERLAGRSATGLALGFAGVFLLVGPQAVLGGHASALGAAAMLGAALSYALATVYLRRTRPADPVPIALGQQVFAAVPATLLVLLTEPLHIWVLPMTSWLAFAGLAAIATALPIVLYFRLVALAAAGKAASVQYVLPLAAMVYGVALLGEAVPAHAVLGGAVVLIGVWLAGTAAGRARGQGPAPR